MVSQFMAAVPSAHQNSFLHDIQYLQSAKQGGHVSKICTVALNGQCSSFFTYLQLDHLLEDPDIPAIDILQVYGHWLHNGAFFSQDFLLWFELVEMTWWDILDTHLLEGCRDTCKSTRSQSQDLNKRLTRMIQHFAYQDPPPQWEKAIPLGLIMSAASAEKPSCQLTLCNDNLIQISLFFSLHSCEYTKTQSHRRTSQFRFCDMQFHNKNGVVPQDALDKLFLRAHSVTIFLDTKKNCVRGQSTTMGETDLEHRNPISAAVRHLLHLKKTAPTPTLQSVLTTPNLPPPHTVLQAPSTSSSCTLTKPCLAFNALASTPMILAPNLFDLGVKLPCTEITSWKAPSRSLVDGAQTPFSFTFKDRWQNSPRESQPTWKNFMVPSSS